LRNTLLIITSDHGENLGEHQLMDHAYCLYDTLLRVPLVICFPASECPSGQRITTQVQTLDLFPTILTMAGVCDAELMSQVQGRDPFLPISGAGGRLAVAEYMTATAFTGVENRYSGFDGSRYDRTLRAVRASNYKYIWASDGQDELYDLGKDPQEEQNLISAELEATSHLRASLEEWLGSFKHAAMGRESVELDTLTIKRLEDLGYLS
jgi:arylsulfatase A-like enzyme